MNSKFWNGFEKRAEEKKEEDRYNISLPQKLLASGAGLGLASLGWHLGKKITKIKDPFFDPIAPILSVLGAYTGIAGTAGILDKRNKQLGYNYLDKKEEKESKR